MKIGLFGIGLNTYWTQFEGLLPRLEGYRRQIAGRLAETGAEVVDAGMVDEPAKAEAAAKLLRESDAELVFLYISTYALSSTVLPVVQRLGVPVVVLNLQPEPAIDYDRLNAMGDRGRMTGEWLAHCQACSVPEVACVFNRLGLRYDIVTGYLAESSVWERIGAWVDAARAASTLRCNRMGVLGHYYCGMLDVYTDLTRLSGVFGTHFELLEMCELKTLRDGRRRSRSPRRSTSSTKRSTWPPTASVPRSSGRPGRRWRSTGWSPGTLSDRWLIITRGRAITRTSSRR